MLPVKVTGSAPSRGTYPGSFFPPGFGQNSGYPDGAVPVSESLHYLRETGQIVPFYLLVVKLQGHLEDRPRLERSAGSFREIALRLQPVPDGSFPRVREDVVLINYLSQLFDVAVKPESTELFKDFAALCPELRDIRHDFVR